MTTRTATMTTANDDDNDDSNNNGGSDDYDDDDADDAAAATLPLSCVANTPFVWHTECQSERERKSVCVRWWGAAYSREKTFSANYNVCTHRHKHTHFGWYVTHTAVVDRMDSIGTRIGWEEHYVAYVEIARVLNVWEATTRAKRMNRYDLNSMHFKYKHRHIYYRTTRLYEHVCVCVSASVRSMPTDVVAFLPFAMHNELVISFRIGKDNCQKLNKWTKPNRTRQRT